MKGAEWLYDNDDIKVSELMRGLSLMSNMAKKIDKKIIDIETREKNFWKYIHHENHFQNDEQ